MYVQKKLSDVNLGIHLPWQTMASRTRTMTRAAQQQSHGSMELSWDRGDFSEHDNLDDVRPVDPM